MELRVKRPPVWQPSQHGTLPGETLRALELTVKDAAGRLGVSRQTLPEKAAITPAMAVRLRKFCGNGPGLWLRMQQAHDLWQAERDLAETMKKIPTLHAA